MDRSQVLYATLPRRIKASIIDGIVLLALFILCPVLISSLIGKDTGLNAIAMFTPALVLEPILISYCGFTLGQYIFGIKVVRCNTGGQCPLLASFARYFTKIILGSVSMVYMLFSKKHQAIHDHVAKTLVVLSEKKIERNPDFAKCGELEQSSDEAYVYPSSLKRFCYFLIWLIPVCVVYGIIIEGVGLLMLPEYTLDSEKLPKGIDIATDIIGSIIFIALAVLASKGYLPGARRKIRGWGNKSPE